MSRDETTGSLFPEPEPARVPDPSRPHAPLADRMRPRSLDELLGQGEALGPESPLRRSIEAGTTPSLILWGPPGSGKTTLAHVIAAEAGVNLRHLTNIGTYRASLRNYLKNHPKIHDRMTLIVRQLQPGPEGLPIEIYAFSNETD